MQCAICDGAGTVERGWWCFCFRFAVIRGWRMYALFLLSVGTDVDGSGASSKLE